MKRFLLIFWIGKLRVWGTRKLLQLKSHRGTNKLRVIHGKRRQIWWNNTLIFFLLVKPKNSFVSIFSCHNICLNTYETIFEWYSLQRFEISWKWCLSYIFTFIILGCWYPFYSIQTSFYLIRGRMILRGRYYKTL